MISYMKGVFCSGGIELSLLSKGGFSKQALYEREIRPPHPPPRIDTLISAVFWAISLNSFRED